MRTLMKLLAAALVAAMLYGPGMGTASASPAAVPRPSCGDGSHSTCLRSQIVWELAYALDKSRADGNSGYKPYCSWIHVSCYESAWISPSYPSSDPHALDVIDDWLARSWWGNYTSAHHGGQCFFFAHDIIYRSTRGWLRLPATTSGLYSLGTSDRTKWQIGDILQYSSGSSHTAIIYRINARDGSGRVTSVDVIDSNFTDPETIGRHTFRAGSGDKWDLASNWRAVPYEKLPKV